MTYFEDKKKISFLFYTIPLLREVKKYFMWLKIYFPIVLVCRLTVLETCWIPLMLIWILSHRSMHARFSTQPFQIFPPVPHNIFFEGGQIFHTKKLKIYFPIVLVYWLTVWETCWIPLMLIGILSHRSMHARFSTQPFQTFFPAPQNIFFERGTNFPCKKFGSIFLPNQIILRPFLFFWRKQYFSLGEDQNFQKLVLINFLAK